MAKYILFDTETTGNSIDDRIIQIGGMIIHDKDNIEVFDELCSTTIPISIEAMAVHHITPEQLNGKPPFIQSSFLAELERYNDPSNFLIAHNINFDLDMLKKEGFENNYTLIDTLRCAKHLLSDQNSHALQYLRYSLGLYKNEIDEATKLGVTIKAHDAIGDVLVMKLLLSKLVERTKEQFGAADIMSTLAKLTITPVLISIFKFGKYKDRYIEDIAKEDFGYLEWMRKNLELDEDMRYTLDYYLR
ncbi:MAG: exonuclease domain-containing protein [Sulfurovaceae bacterium]|nr:exonuclease domain-containing protein [Sulfurovaceae bacterium]